MPISAKDTVLTSRSAAAWTAYLVLLLTGRVSLGTAVVVLLGFEVILGTVIVAVAWRAARTHPGERVTAVVRAVLPGPVATFARFEIRQLRSLGLLARGRIDTEGPGDQPIPYAAGRGSVYLMIGAACVIELVVVHLVDSWERMGAWSRLQWRAFGLSAPSTASRPRCSSPDAMMVSTTSSAIMLASAWSESK